MTTLNIHSARPKLAKSNYHQQGRVKVTVTGGRTPFENYIT